MFSKNNINSWLALVALFILLAMGCAQTDGKSGKTSIARDSDSGTPMSVKPGTSGSNTK